MQIRKRVELTSGGESPDEGDESQMKMTKNRLDLEDNKNDTCFILNVIVPKCALSLLYLVAHFTSSMF